MEALAVRARVLRAVDVLVHDAIPGPMTCGVVHPAIVLPADAETWTDVDLHRAVVHELEHVRRGDWISQCLARVICAGYWFHPLVWIARRQLQLEAERACDDAVLAGVEATAYADQLIALAKRLSATAKSPLLAMANRRDLAARVGAVLDSRQARGRAGAAAIALSAVVAVALVATISPLRIVAEAQSASTQTSSPAMTGRPQDAGPIGPIMSPAQFQAASIKPCQPGVGVAAMMGGRGRLDMSPGRISLRCLTVAEMILRVYVQFGDPPPANPRGFIAADGVKQVVREAPAWVYTDRYTVEANAEGSPAPISMMGAMLRALLEDQLQLKVHLDQRLVPIYALTVAKGGFKLHSVDADSCTPADPNALGGPTAQVSDGKPRCAVGSRDHGPNLTVRSTGVTLDQFAHGLGQMIMNRPVIDRTGIAGRYTFEIEFVRDDSTDRLPMFPSGAAESADGAPIPVGASIFTVLEQQLGLKLEQAQGPQRVPRNRSRGTALGELRGAATMPFIVVLLAAGISPLRQVAWTLPLTGTRPQATSAQSTTMASPHFSAVSIRPCSAESQGAITSGRGGGWGRPFSTSPGRVRIQCMNVSDLIDVTESNATDPLINDVDRPDGPKRSRHGPAWVSSLAYSDRYTIDARSEGNPDNRTMLGPMLLAILEDRFQLKMHQEIEEIPMYALTVAKGGLKLRPMAAGECTPADPDPTKRRLMFPAPGQKPVCGSVVMGRNAGGATWTLVAGGTTLGVVALELSGVADRPVIDQTRVSGLFSFRLECEVDENVLGPRALGPAVISAGSTVFGALDRKLGLKVVPIKGPHGFLVIDHVERPSEN